MFNLINSKQATKWTEVCLAVPGHTAIVVHVADELGEVLGFRTQRGRIVLTTSSGIPMIVRRSDGMEGAMIHVRKVAS